MLVSSCRRVRAHYRFTFQTSPLKAIQCCILKLMTLIAGTTNFLGWKLLLTIRQLIKNGSGGRPAFWTPQVINYVCFTPGQTDAFHLGELRPETRLHDLATSARLTSKDRQPDISKFHFPGLAPPSSRRDRFSAYEEG